MSPVETAAFLLSAAVPGKLDACQLVQNSERVAQEIHPASFSWMACLVATVTPAGRGAVCSPTALAASS